MYSENEYTELKSKLTKEIKREIVALANSKGGTIYIGINDDGSIKGLENIDADMEALSGMIREGIKSDLSLYTNIEIREIDGKNVLVLKIMSGPNKPYYLSDKGLKPSGVFIRHGNVTAPASDENIRKMLKENHDSFENEVASNQNLHFNFLNNEFNNKNMIFNESKYKILNIKNADNYFTNLALLLSDECPFSIKCAIFDGNDKINFKDRKEFSGSIIKQLEDCLEYLNLVNRINGKIIDYKRVDIRDYPEYAIRESILNAIIHRNYNFSGSILISIFDNRIEVTSLGGLVSGITLEDIISGSISQPRNKNLANIFYRLKYVESYGTGIGRMLNIYDQFNLKPTFSVTDNTFKVTLPNINYKPEVKNIIVDDLSQKEKIIKYLEQYGKIKRETVDMLFDISSARSKIILSEMIKENIILKKGTGKNTYYVLK